MRQAVHRISAVAAALGGAFFGTSAHAVDYATVVSSTPVSVSVPVPRQVCSDGQQLVQPRPSGAGAVIGAIAGGVIGHNLGNGFGRAAATGVGAVAGAVIGEQVEVNGSPPIEVPVRRCQTVSTYENRVVGYDVMYDYAGQRYSTRMARDPGQKLAVSVQPADAGAASLPVPAYAGAAPDTALPYTPYYEPVPRTIYYAPVPPVMYVAPMIGFGFGYYGGYRGRHWH
jgi:uncharacterized protein YcfJ